MYANYVVLWYSTMDGLTNDSRGRDSYSVLVRTATYERVIPTNYGSRNAKQLCIPGQVKFYALVLE